MRCALDAMLRIALSTSSALTLRCALSAALSSETIVDHPVEELLFHLRLRRRDLRGVLRAREDAVEERVLASLELRQQDRTLADDRDDALDDHRACASSRSRMQRPERAGRDDHFSTQPTHAKASTMPPKREATLRGDAG